MAAAGLLCLLVGACSVPDEVNPVSIYRRISGQADADRLPPPGMERPTPSLAAVPPRPERPPVELRNAISDALVQDRSASREPLVLRDVPAREVPPELSDQPAMPAGPPRRPALAAAPVIPWGDPPSGRSRPRPGRTDTPAATTPIPPEMPEEAPAPPPPELLGPPPAPRP